MNLIEWRSNVDLAIELKKLLDNTTIKNALSVIDGMTAAKTIGSGAGLLQQATNSAVLFGYDSGRASAIADLYALAEVPEEISAIEPSYQGEF